TSSAWHAAASSSTATGTATGNQGRAGLPASRAAPGHPLGPRPDQRLRADRRLIPALTSDSRRPVEPAADPQRHRARPLTSSTVTGMISEHTPAQPAPRRPITLNYMALATGPGRQGPNRPLIA